MRLPDATLVDRFHADLAALGIAASARIGVAVSGGPDSLALLLLARAAGLAVEAATVDHGLRPESGAEAAFVAELCASLGVPHATLRLDGGRRGNISAWAREARYAALKDWATANGLALILTAHHADDQLETMIMRLNRGSGVGGLAGVRRAGDGLARPLLGWRKHELQAIVANAGLTPVEDPSNRDDRFDRARLRKALADADWLDPVAAARSADALADADAALNWAAAELIPRRIVRTGDAIRFDPRDLPHEIVRRLLIAMIGGVAGGARLRGEAVERALASLRRGRTITLAGVKCAGGEVWTLSPAPPRRTASAGSSASGIVR